LTYISDNSIAVTEAIFYTIVVYQQRQIFCESECYIASSTIMAGMAAVEEAKLDVRNTVLNIISFTKNEMLKIVRLCT